MTQPTCSNRPLFSTAPPLAIAKSRATSAASARNASISSGTPQNRPGPKPGPNGPRGPCQPRPKPNGPRGPPNPRPKPNGPRGPCPSPDIQGGVQPSQFASSGESPGRLLNRPNIVLHLLSIERTFATYRIYQIEQCDMSFLSYLRYIALKVVRKKQLTKNS